jgi:hypothetical protein
LGPPPRSRLNRRNWSSISTICSGVIAARRRRQRFAVRLVERHAQGADMILADNYGEAGALQLFGRRLPPVASAAGTMRYGRPQAAGRRAPVVGYSRDAAHFRSGYRVLTRISARPGLAEHRRHAAELSQPEQVQASFPNTSASPVLDLAAVRGLDVER